MSQISKQYEELVIDSERKLFHKAHVKLTVVYILIVVSIVLCYNVVILADLNMDIANNKKIASGIMAPEAEETPRELLIEIALEDVSIIIISSALSYLLASYTLRPIRRSLLLQKTFSENAAHELRTPLAVIKSEIEVLLRNSNSSKEDTQETLKDIVEEVDRLSFMTNDLLLLARFGQNSTTKRDNIDLSEIVRKIVNKITPLAESKGVKVELISNADNQAKINGDKLALDRVFLNILQNAITHTQAEGKIAVVINSKEKDFVVSIKDTGRGIKSKDLPHVFERFYKGNESQGTGLGLPIVKEIVDSHDGEVVIRSKEGEGTEVVIKLPKLNQI